LDLVDGAGGSYRGLLIGKDKKKVEVKITERRRESVALYHIHLCIAPTKNAGRIEWCAEKLTELGISRITPMICQRSERDKLNMKRIKKIVIAAMKQSGRAWLPRIDEVTPFKEIVPSLETELKYIAHLSHKSKPLARHYKRGRDVVILVGPEGDFSDNEIMLGRENGLELVTLGTRRLRTETAGIAACQIIHTLNV
jgi:16S rRNA (uracil1498-N3)-methyltransferase